METLGAFKGIYKGYIGVIGGLYWDSENKMETTGIIGLLGLGFRVLGF